ncbi:hypothetical protein IGI04_006937 [Brassica rapa subsp. trilocularis]|uniref:Uncharacterized protein n=1 Tax=Brassica rapa subsp. trilocularis TaxID=1813537 RepID=A0ABQ7NIA8_BRACM|nr:hypothetical protein IGI04_006937 [Brassica rapa subsp. trilocularis]
MSSSDAVLAQSGFDALRVGRSAQIIVGRLLRFWYSMKIKMQGEFMGITLILLDEKYCKGQIFFGLHHPTTTMSLFPCEASMAASQDFKPILICFLCKLF